jgi:thiosulfate/3-mercaptopyruvate sulfurtransferase
VRSPDEFSGKILARLHLPQEQSQRPGAHPRRHQCSVEARRPTRTATFKSDEDLAKLYAEAGLDGEKETIAYCRHR